jgi:triphosphoribosyl-dephospho-CoA synthase
LPGGSSDGLLDLKEWFIISIDLIQLACLWEANVAKPGNVHPGAAFADTCYDDFVLSAKAIGPVFEHAANKSVGQLALDAVRATNEAVGKNTNLGIILILAPLAKAGSAERADVQQVLHSLTVDDACLVYEAIRLAQPGGLGQVQEADVRAMPTITLLEAMTLAAERDLIARQYANGYEQVYSLLLPTLEQHHPMDDLHGAILETFMVGLAQLGDTLIGRKCGVSVMLEAQQRAQAVLASSHRTDALVHFDAWLRADGNRRNPGTMADLLAATIHLALRRGTMNSSLPI